ncbi:MAG: CCA tRNA nucleotidyltransferase [Clostridium sp.]
MDYNLKMPCDVKYIIDVLKNNGYEGYMVGGCVRDLLLKREPNDYDITTNAKPEIVASLFDKVILTGLKHGTVTIILNNNQYEVTTYRMDGDYQDSRHPENVTFVNDIKEDLSRRDFTINAMAYNEENGLVDYFNGIEDLNNKIVRTVGDPVKRFNEDSLRMLRAVRFSVQLDFRIDKSTMEAVKKLSRKIQNISKERIREEFNKIIIKDPWGLKILHECRLLGYIVEELEKSYGLDQNNPYHIYDLFEHSIRSSCYIKDDLTLRLTMLLHDLGKLKTRTIDDKGISHYYGHAKESEHMAECILRNLKYDNNTISKVKKLIYYHDCEFKKKLSVKKIMNIIGAELFKDLMMVKRADISAQNPIYEKERICSLDNIEKIYNEIINEKECFQLKDLDISGNDLIELGVNKGRDIGIMLNFLLESVMKNNEYNSKENLIKLVNGKLKSEKQ